MLYASDRRTVHLLEVVKIAEVSCHAFQVQLTLVVILSSDRQSLPTDLNHGSQMYDFHTLSPPDFEELVRDLLQAELKVTCESFGSGPDLGIDFRFSTGADDTIIQAKHFVTTGANGLVGTAKLEDAKVKALKASRYILATSVSMTPMLKARIQKAMPSAPLKARDILGKQDLNNLLRKHPDIERKHFKLWLSSTAVLERILKSGVYNRTKAEMTAIRSVVPKFVYNGSVPQAEAILNKHGALIVAGEPGVGKSTLARMLVWLHAEQGWKIAVIDDIREAFEVAHEGEKRLIFFDDFLGQIRLSSDVIRDIDQRFPPFLQRVRSSKDVRFILTTRDYILRQAQAESSKLSSTEFNASEFVLNVGHYTRAVRAQILFNHLFFSKLRNEQRDSLLADNFFLRMIDHRNFNPRLIEMLVSPDFISLSDRPIRETVLLTLENPEALWEKPFRSHISEDGRALMLAIFFNSSRTTLIDLEKTFVRMAKASDIRLSRANSVRRFRLALKELEGSVLAIQNQRVSFSNPGVRDYLQRAIVEDRFVESAVEVVTDYAEVFQAWSFYKAQGSENQQHSLTKQWVAAMLRLSKSASGSVLHRLALLLEVYEALRSRELIGLIKLEASRLSAVRLRASEATAGCFVMQLLVESHLPKNDRQGVIVSINAAMRKMVQDESDTLILNDLRSVIRGLEKLDVEPTETAEAIAEGLKLFVESMEIELEDVQEEDDLAEFEELLLELLNDYNVNDTDAITAIGDQRESIEEKSDDEDNDDDDDDEGYTPTRRLKDEPDSDEAIRSIFDTLRKR